MTGLAVCADVGSTWTKVAVVDVQRAVANTEDGLRAQATLKKLFDSRQQELNRKQNEMQKLILRTTKQTSTPASRFNQAAGVEDEE